MTTSAQPQLATMQTRNGGVAQAYRLICESSVPAYDVCLVEDLLGANSFFLAKLLAHRRALVVTTPTVERVYGDRLRNSLAAWQLDAEVLVLACSEATKTPEQALRVCQAALDRQLGRTDVLVSFGGGVCSDLVTLAASLVRRGIAHVRIPTTLIGQVDAGIGIKAGVNFGGKKNFLGCFCPPEEVLVDLAFLRSLGRSDLGSGLAEIIKMAIICDRLLFDALARHGQALLSTGFAEPWQTAREVIWRSCQLMLNELAPNIYEDQTYERLVDFGHTFSPKLESKSDYRIPHGHAVAIDMAISAAVARELGMLSMEECEAIVGLLQDLELPVTSELLDAASCAEALEDAARHRGGSPNLVLPQGIGSASFVRRLEDLPTSLLGQALEGLAALVGQSRRAAS